jgi:hypothetical protein
MLKQVLTGQPLFHYRNFTKPLLLTTDTNNEALGLVLSQGYNGLGLPTAYASRILNTTEHNYPTVKKELLAVVWG